MLKFWNDCEGEKGGCTIIFKIISDMLEILRAYGGAPLPKAMTKER